MSFINKNRTLVYLFTSSVYLFGSEIFFHKPTLAVIKNDHHHLMKQLTLLLAISAIAVCSYGQTTFKRNDIYVEAGGNGLFASVNYERQITKEPGLGIRLGVGFYSEKAFYLTIPVGINYLFKLKDNKSFIDAGLGATWTRIDGNLFGDSKNSYGEHFVNVVPSVGYRF